MLYEEDDDTIVDAIYFMDWGESLKCYNRMKKKLQSTFELGLVDKHKISTKC